MKPIRRPAKIKILRWPLLFAFCALLNCAQAQTLTVLHAFSSFAPPPPPEGATPLDSLVLSGGILYGTTEFGGDGDGTVFAISTDGEGYTNLHAFTQQKSVPATGNPEGANPACNLIVSDNLLYGTTENGGSNGEGSVFVASLDGTVVKTLYSFTNGADGANPVAGLTLSGGTLFGTAKYGGHAYSGTIFAIDTNGMGFTNLYTFTNGIDGQYPAGGLVLSGKTLFGTTESGGLDFAGAIFSIKTNGTGFESLHNFIYSDGESPAATLTLVGGTLYGTASGGGAASDGVLFAIGADGSNFTNFYSFTGLNDGSAPEAALTFSGNILYGTASAGGKDSSGTVFSVNTNGSSFTTLYSFTGGTDGMTPESSLLLTNNLLYGTTEYGGVFSNGTVFAVGTGGTGFTNLYTFTGADDGANPVAGLLGDSLYGTTLNGGNAGDGTLFVIQTDGSGFASLHSFLPPSAEPTETNSDGAYPVANLILSGDTLYGTTEAGGAFGNGTVFAVNTDGSGFTSLHTFTAGADGATPVANLVLSGDTLYGTTLEGGEGDNGTVFSIHTDGSDFTVLYRFTGLDDGGAPGAGLVLTGNTLYGTTESGGLFYGTIFAINTDGTDFQTLYTFSGGEDGSGPQAALTLSGNTLYGTAEAGGTNYDGTVFSIQTNGSNFMVLHEFTGVPQGANPYGALLLSGTTLYGTTYSGGVTNDGTVFAIQTDGAGFTNLYSFTYGPNGAYPAAGLVLAGKSVLYGTAEEGGNSGSGAIFTIRTNGTDYNNILSFMPYSTGGSSVNSDGAYPLAGLIASEGTLYGTAYAGGSGGYGTVYSMLTNGSNFATLYNFTNGIDGAFPHASLTRISNTLFSTATGGGSYGMGTVFSLLTNGSGFMSLHSFGSGTDGSYPSGSLLVWSNVLYGTTSSGGLSNKGTIFAINPDGTGYTNLYSFTGGSDGATPLASLAVWSNDWLICTASAGGTSNFGTLFALKVTTQPTKLDDPTAFWYDFPGGAGGDYPIGTPIVESGDGSSPEAQIRASGTTIGGGVEENGGSASWGNSGASSLWDSGGCCSWGGESCCGGGSGFRMREGNVDVTSLGRSIAGDEGTFGWYMVNSAQNGFSAVNVLPFNNTIGAGPDANYIKWNGYNWFTAESGGDFGFGSIVALKPETQTLLPEYSFTGGNLGSVATGKLLGWGHLIYGAAAYGGIGQHGLDYALQPCSGTQDFQAPVIDGAIYNKLAQSLYLGFSITTPTTTPTDPTTQLQGTLYDTSGTPSPVDTFNFSTQSGSTFTTGHMFRLGTMMMPSSVAFSYSGLCGESTLSPSVPVYEAPALNYSIMPGNQLKVSWPASTPWNYTLQFSSTIGRGSMWQDVTSPAPVLSNGDYSETVTPGLGNLFLRLRYSF